MAPRNDNPGRVTRSMAAANAMSDLVKAAKPTRVEKAVSKKPVTTGKKAIPLTEDGHVNLSQTHEHLMAM
jgi:hypothetical protein